MNPFWLLGFIEGEGTFFSAYFQVGQSVRSLYVLEQIHKYLQR